MKYIVKNITYNSWLNPSSEDINTVYKQREAMSKDWPKNEYIVVDEQERTKAYKEKGYI